MNPVRTSSVIGQRELQWAGGEARVGRNRAQAPAERFPAPPQPQLDAAAAHAAAMAATLEESLRLAREEGLARGRDEGRRLGYEEGLRQGLAAAQEQVQRTAQEAAAAASKPLEQACRELSQLLVTVQEQIRETKRCAESDLVETVFEVLCRVLGASLASRDGLTAQVAQLLARADADGPGLALHVHPTQARWFEHHAWSDTPGLTLIADPQVLLGGCVLKSARGTLDARLETILASCKAALLEAHAERAPVPAAGPA